MIIDIKTLLAARRNAPDLAIFLLTTSVLLLLAPAVLRRLW